MKKFIASSLAMLALTCNLSLATPPSQNVVNVNSADQATLAGIPGIGKNKAQAIIKYRIAHGPFKDINDLVEVKGITSKVLQKILKRNMGKIVAKN